MIELTSKQRKNLEKLAHDLQPVVIVGGAGVTDGVVSMVENSLAAHELIKVKFNEFKNEKRELSNEIKQKTDSTMVRLIGNVLILYRPAKEANDRKFEKDLNKLEK